MTYAIGLDIGIASIGHAVVALNEAEEPCGILRMGVRVFDTAENPNTGASLALPRREARSARRRLRRHRHRIERIQTLLVESTLLSEAELVALYGGQLTDVYALRTRALDQRVTDGELARILIHLAQRRGFRSNHKADEKDKEAGKMLTAIEANRRRMEEQHYRTVGEMYDRDPAYAAHKRNKSENYLSTVQRDMVEEEARLIMDTQRALGNEKVTDAFKAQYVDILTSQRSFEEGPGGGSPYGGAQIENMIGVCTLDPPEKRAPKGSYSFEYFQLLQKVNHIRLLGSGGGRALTHVERKLVIDLAHKHETLRFSAIRKELGIDEGTTFNCVFYEPGIERDESEKKDTLGCLKSYHQMRRALERIAKGRMLSFDTDKRDAAAYVLSVYKTEETARVKLREAGIDPLDAEQLLSLDGLSKFGHISIKACRALIPYLEQGMRYDEACTAAGYAFRGHEAEKSRLLPASVEEMENITSPVARRAIAQTIKVVNAIIRKQGASPTFINIELAREMSRDFSERKEAESEMRENAVRNEHMMERIRTELGRPSPTGFDLVKLKLYEEQGGVCLYSQRPISIARLFEPGYVEVDHIVPYSISFDDRYRNKALVFAEENRRKGNRLPLQYMSPEQQDAFHVWVSTQVRDYRKRQILLKETITEEDEARFKERNLQDTKTMSRFLYNYINDHLLFADSARGRRKRVTAVNGSVTAYLRKRWGITKNRADGDLHHAVDALVIVCATDGLIQRVSRYNGLNEALYQSSADGSILFRKEQGEMIAHFPLPWEDFRQELTMRTALDPAAYMEAMRLPFYDGIDPAGVKPIFVSRMPRRKVSSPAHKDTIKSARVQDEGYVLVRRPLTDLKIDSAGELKDYYQPESDRLLYEALFNRLRETGGDAKKAFMEPFYKPKHDGTRGPLVKKVKLYEKTTLAVPVHNGTAVADNDTMVRIDIFHVENDGYYLVPIYVADTLKPELPSLAVIAYKPYEQWKPMRETDFIFSLYPGDLVRATHSKNIKLTNLNKDSTLDTSYETKSEMLYFVSSCISTGAIKAENHDRTYGISSLGIKTLQALEKYQVDMLGDYTKVGKEKRQRFQ